MRDGANGRKDLISEVGNLPVLPVHHTIANDLFFPFQLHQSNTDINGNAFGQSRVRYSVIFMLSVIRTPSFMLSTNRLFQVLWR